MGANCVTLVTASRVSLGRTPGRPVIFHALRYFLTVFFRHEFSSAAFRRGDYVRECRSRTKTFQACDGLIESSALIC